MKYSYKWLKKLSGTKKSPEELAKMIGLKGFELEEIEVLKDRFKDFVVGEIVSLDKHPNADKLQFVRVDIGGKHIVDVVCGAWNIEKGDKVPVALPGSILPQNKLVVEKREIRGVVSYGMLCAEDELGLGKDHDGIMILGNDSKPGTPISEVLDLEDQMIEFDVLPNRAHDCLSHVGMAREICAMEGREFKMQNEGLKGANENSKWLNIEIEDADGCARYIGTVLKNIKIGPSPKWMQARLVVSGMEPINNVVDITNYVMLEIGNPLHAFDYSRINNDGVSIIVRKAKKNEKLELLDETSLELDPEDLVIADEEKAIALAGIKGGKYSGISDTTTEIVLEAANFNGYRVRKSRQRHGLATEAQARFEKQISPQIAKQATQRAIELLQKHANAQLVEVIDEDKSEIKKQKLDISLEAIEKLLGLKVEAKDARSILDRLGFETKLEKNDIKVSVPHWRLDIEGPEDLIEEIGRIIGYDKIPDKPLMSSVEIVNENEMRSFEWGLREKMAGLGFDELTNYSFYGQQDIELCQLERKHFEIERPLSTDLKYMRTTLLVGLLKNVLLNMKNIESLGMSFEVNQGISFAIFEMGNIYKVGQGNKPREEKILAGSLFSEKKQDADLFYDAKGRIDALLKSMGAEKVGYRPVNEKQCGMYHLTRTVKIELGGKKIGIVGEVDKNITKNYGIKKRVVCFELDVEKLFQIGNREKSFVDIRKYPPVLRDVSMFVEPSIEAAEVVEIIEGEGGKILKDVKYFDKYEKGGRKSLACHLIFWDSEKTLTNDEVEDAMKRIVGKLEENGIEIRKQ